MKIVVYYALMFILILLSSCSSNKSRSIANLNELILSEKNTSDGNIELIIKHTQIPAEGIKGIFNYLKLKELYTQSKIKTYRVEIEENQSIKIYLNQEAANEIKSILQSRELGDIEKFIHLSTIELDDISPDIYLNQKLISPETYWKLITLAKNISQNDSDLFQSFLIKLLLPLKFSTEESVKENYIESIEHILSDNSPSFQKQNELIKLSIPNEINPYLNYKNIISTTDNSTTELFFDDNISTRSFEKIRNAKKTLDISVSFLRGEGPIQSIEDALKNGVKVRLIMDERNLNKGAKEQALYQKMLERFKDYDIQIEFISPQKLSKINRHWFPIYHRKLIIIDRGESIIVSSDNLDVHKNIDSSILIENQQGSEWLNIFEKDWEIATDQKVISNNNIYQKFKGLLGIGHGTFFSNLKSLAINNINLAKKRIWISIYELNDEEILESLIARKKQNPSIDIKVLLCWSKLSVWFNGKKYEKDRHINTIKALQENGIEVRNFPESSNMRLHSRILITDDHFIAGSADYSKRALDRHYDLSVSTKFTEKNNQTIRENFLELWKASEVPSQSTTILATYEKLNSKIETFFSHAFQIYQTLINNISQPKSNNITFRFEDYTQQIEKLEKNLEKKILAYQNKREEPFSHEKMQELKMIEKDLDKLIMEEIDTIATVQVNFAHEVNLKNKTYFNDTQKIINKYEQYLSSRSEYGGAKDYKRYAAFTELIFETQKLVDKLENENISSWKQLILQIKESYKKIVNLISTSTKLAIPSLQMLNSAFQNLTKTDIGFGKAVDLFFKKWAYDSNIKVEVTGKDFLNNKQRKVRLFVPTHRDANLDAVAFAALNVDNPVVFGALNLKNHPIFGIKDNPLVKPLINSLENNDTFILAGAKEKPIDKFLRIIEKNKEVNALIYPEGQVGLGLKESRPVRQNFSKALLAKLISENIDFEIVPVVYVNGSQYFEYHNNVEKIRFDSSDKVLKVKVLKPITSEEIKSFFKQFNEDDFSSYLRMHWLFNIDNEDNEILGQGKWKSIVNAFKAKFGPKDNCKEILHSFMGP